MRRTKRPVSVMRLAFAQSASSRHAASNAAWWPPEITSLGHGACATASSGVHSPQQLGEEFNTVLEKSLRCESLPSCHPPARWDQRLATT
jgi:hypothetical protein